MNKIIFIGCLAIANSAQAAVKKEFVLHTTIEKVIERMSADVKKRFSKPTKKGAETTYKLKAKVKSRGEQLWSLTIVKIVPGQYLTSVYTLNSKSKAIERYVLRLELRKYKNAVHVKIFIDMKLKDFPQKYCDEIAKAGIVILENSLLDNFERPKNVI